MVEVLIGIGSNLENPIKQVRRAIEILKSLPESQLASASSLFSSQPQGPQDQDNYINAVVLVNTALQPATLLNELKSIEAQFGRVKTRHWGERIIDLDILFYGTQEIRCEHPDLRIPHREALKRDFVVLPALEIVPEWKLPNGECLEQYRNTDATHVLTKLP